MVHLFLWITCMSIISPLIVFLEGTLNNGCIEEQNFRNPVWSTIDRGYSCRHIIRPSSFLTISWSKMYFSTLTVPSLAVAILIVDCFRPFLHALAWHMLRWSCKCLVPFLVSPPNYSLHQSHLAAAYIKRNYLKHQNKQCKISSRPILKIASHNWQSSSC